MADMLGIFRSNRQLNFGQLIFVNFLELSRFVHII